MRRGLGAAVSVFGLVALLASFAYSSTDADMGLGTRVVGAALIFVGGCVRTSDSTSGRAWVGLLGLAVCIPSLFALLLFGYLRLGMTFPMAIDRHVWLYLGVATAGGGLLAVVGSERSVAASDRYQRLHADLALMLGRVDLPRQAVWRDHVPDAIRLFCSVSLLGMFAIGAHLSPVQVLGLGSGAWLIAYGTIALHELAHAVCGRVCGYQVESMSIAGGPLLARFSIGSVSVHLGLLPAHGQVRFRFGGTPVWRGMRRVAWAGPASGVVPLCIGLAAMASSAGNSVAFWCAVIAVMCGAISVGQLIPERIRFGNHVVYSDGIWLFLSEHVRRQIVVVLELSRMRFGLPGSASIREAIPGFAEFWASLNSGPQKQQWASVLASLASATRPVAVSATEWDMCELFLLGTLLRLSLKENELGGLESAVDAYVIGSAPLLFKTRALDLATCALLFPPRTEGLALAERWARRAVEMLPDDVTLYGTLGVALIELGQKEEGRRHLRHFLQHSRGKMDRRLAREHLKR